MKQTAETCSCLIGLMVKTDQVVQKSSPVFIALIRNHGCQPAASFSPAHCGHRQNTATSICWITVKTVQTVAEEFVFSLT